MFKVRAPGFSASTIAIGYAVVSLLVLAMFAAPLWFAWDTNIERARTELLMADTNRLSRIFARRGPEALAEAIDVQAGNAYEGIGKILMLGDVNSVKLAGNLESWPTGVPQPAPGEAPGRVKAATIEVRGVKRRVELILTRLPGGYQLLVASNLNRFERLESLFVYGLLGCAATVLMVAVLGGLLIRRAILNKVDSISQTTAAIIEGKLTRRLPEPERGDELEMLTHTVNRMLDQIEHLVHSVQNVSNAIAHDLRTPLSELRARLEELSVARPPETETFAEVDAAINDVDRVMAIFNALLRLADIDSGMRRGGFVQVDLARLAAEVAEFYLPVAELKDIALTFQPDGNLFTSGDPLLLAQALGNLVENALKYAPEQGVIAIHARRSSPQQIELTVADDGPGVPDQEKRKVVERFYRGDASRGTPGVGLGLSLVSAVAQLHGGKLVLADNKPGLRAVISIDVQGVSAEADA
ncbi:sensor histidine kinase [Janthinobacterium agaricidamnosum]|uniref:histidine kinase n=1 Tax=Janthinobacterium agaricidamnosum NBRC 102515 = DSM 9628 TaxID=1349767 RepID=W0V9L8_9BURK|nr:ATP-binding protein [Janthinobacterium agaricidamnosum]CDG83947.1 HAMP domain protein [Janthinobacterium agaricidamnosum NBRC 102515 = DSM 9628]